MENQENKYHNISGYLFVGFMFAGMGIGTALGSTEAGIMIGMGAGFIAMAVYKTEKNK